MSKLVVVNGFLTLDGKRYLEMNRSEKKAFELSLSAEKKPLLRVENRSLIKKAVQK